VGLPSLAPLNVVAPGYRALEVGRLVDEPRTVLAQEVARRDWMLVEEAVVRVDLTPARASSRLEETECLFTENKPKGTTQDPPIYLGGREPLYHRSVSNAIDGIHLNG
jgi:hypothetical protein